MDYSLGMISLYVRNIQKAKEFYADFLGMQVISQLSSDSFVFLQPTSGTAIALQNMSALPEGMQAQPGGIELNLEVDDIDAAYRAWQDKGIDIVTEVGDMGAGRFFRARDTEGHLLTVYQLYDMVKNMRRQMGT